VKLRPAAVLSPEPNRKRVLSVTEPAQPAQFAESSNLPSARFWGQGLATEGSLAALEFGFCELHLDTVVAFAVEANAGSRRGTLRIPNSGKLLLEGAEQ